LNKKILFYIITVILMLTDQISKLIINLTLKEPLQVLPNILSLDKVYNSGAAFSIFQNNTVFLILITLAILICIIYFVIEKEMSKPEIISLAFISGGAIGNLIDRICSSFVIDFIRLDFINFPVFNLADIFINIGVILLIVSILMVKNGK